MLKQVAAVGFTPGDSALMSLLLKGNSKFLFRGTCDKLSDLHYVDVLLIHIRSRSTIGRVPVEFVKKNFPKTAVLVVSKFTDLNTIQTILRAGANGYILKTADFFNQLLAALTEVTNGGGPLSPKVARVLVKSFHATRKKVHHNESVKRESFSQRSTSTISKISYPVSLSPG